MKLIEALTIMQKPPKPDSKLFSVFLGCGFMPLHLKTFLGAYLRQVCVDHGIEIKTGVYGDLAGNLALLAHTPADAGAIVFEWSDFDPRLGIRSAGSWTPNVLSDIEETVSAQAIRFLSLLENAAQSVPLVVCLPSIELPPVFHHPRRQCGPNELLLWQSLISFGVNVGNINGVKVLNLQMLNRLSPMTNRFDAKSELLAGFPYTLSHASVIAELLAFLIKSPPSKKGLVTDLDDTLWRGILGEVGIDGISWDIDNNSHMHAVYQQVLHALSESGILIGVASKNDPVLVEKALQREDILLPREDLFPMEVHWGQKSISIGRILKAWNIGAESIVFVDDSPMELEEVNSVFPEVTCRLFPKGRNDGIYELLKELRDLFAQERIFEEDAIRLKSLRQETPFEETAFDHDASLSKLLERAEAELEFSFEKVSSDSRAFQLINKTNQFNLNGRRYTEGIWQKTLKMGETFLVTVSYKDKYGLLGKIAVLIGRRKQKSISVDTWVMSCRAFGRRIEFKCLEYLFHRFEAKKIQFDFKATPRNGPLQDFFESVLGEKQNKPFAIPKDVFMNKCPELFHKVKEV